MAGCFLYLASTLTDWFLYKTHLYLCKQLYDASMYELPESSDKPIQVFEHCPMDLGRWSVFMIWLETCPNAFPSFQEIQRRHTIPSIVTLEGLVCLKESVKD